MEEKLADQACDKAIAAYSEGDQDALAVIFDCMARMIFSVAYAITENYQDAEDVLQDTMIEITRYANAYRGGSNARAWILAMARHRSIDVVRKRRTVVAIEDAELSEAPETRFDLSRLEALDLLSTLDEEKRQILLLRLYAELPFKEIAAIMSISVASAQKKYQRAISELRDYHSQDRGNA